MCVEGCLLLLLRTGQVRIYDFNYSFGMLIQSLWLHCQVSLTINGLNAFNEGESLVFTLQAEVEGFGQSLQVFRINSKSTTPECVFRYWIINEHGNDKQLPDIVRTLSRICKVRFVKFYFKFLKSELSSTKCDISLRGRVSILAFEMITTCRPDGVLRLLDWACLDSENCTSILAPESYLPALK